MRKIDRVRQAEAIAAAVRQYIMVQGGYNPCLDKVRLVRHVAKALGIRTWIVTAVVNSGIDKGFLKEYYY